MFCVEFLRESQAQNKDLVRQVSELQAIRVQLESDQNNLTSELSEVSEALRAAEGRLASSSSTLSQIRTDAERRLKEKDEEIDSIRLVIVIHYCEIWSTFCFWLVHGWLARNSLVVHSRFPGGSRVGHGWLAGNSLVVHSQFGCFKNN